MHDVAFRWGIGLWLKISMIIFNNSVRWWARSKARDWKTI